MKKLSVNAAALKKDCILADDAFGSMFWLKKCHVMQ
jgi:hypothetical protein